MGLGLLVAETQNILINVTVQSLYQCHTTIVIVITAVTITPAVSKAHCVPSTGPGAYGLYII